MVDARAKVEAIIAPEELGNKLDGRFQRQYPGRRNGCGDAGAALPYHISCGALLPGLDIVAVRFRDSYAQCTVSAQRGSDGGSSM